MLRFGEYFTTHQNKVTQKYTLCKTYSCLETQPIHVITTKFHISMGQWQLQTHKLFTEAASL